jgi:hypothetical protein
VTICHLTGNGGRHTIAVSCDALAAHLGHGDTIGACPIETPDGGPRQVNGAYQDNYYSAYANPSHKPRVVSGYAESTFWPYKQAMRDQLQKIRDLALRHCCP